MIPPGKIPLSDLDQHITDSITLFVCCASFEERSLSLAKAIGADRVLHTVICVNEDYAKPATKNIIALKEMFSSKHEILSLHTNDPILSADRFSAIFDKALVESKGTIFVDITTFSHEQLLILIRLLREKLKRHKIIAGYTGANEYAIGLSDDQKWLSQGVDDVRSVLGYPGSLVPSRRLHLIVLAGFESERATKLIEAYDPEIISLGIGEQSGSISDHHHSINKMFHKKLLDFMQMVSAVNAKVEKFQFSCVEPRSAQRTIIEQAKKFPTYNTVVAPMNTKISTLGAAFAAFEEESLQICYAHPSSYNTENYSSPSADCRLFDLIADLDSAKTD